MGYSNTSCCHSSSRRRKRRSSDVTVEAAAAVVARARRLSPLFIALVLASRSIVPTAPFAIIGIQASNPAASQAAGVIREHRDAGIVTTSARTAAAAAKVSPSSASALRAISHGKEGGSVKRSSLSPLFGSSSRQTAKYATGSISDVSTHTLSESVSDHNARMEDMVNERNWKGGEYNTTLFNRLLYRYVSPLVNMASKRHLDAEDAFDVPEQKKMKTSVSRLEEKYAKCRKKAHRRLQEISVEEDDIKRQSKNMKKPRRRKRDRIATNEAIVLAKALLKSQKQTLIVTGILRALNTAVQALPAILIARLLRQIEAGKAVSPSQSLLSAVALVSVLSVKMILENQYFHGVVKCAGEVRGSLAGLIFDKSLRLVGESKEIDDNEGKGGQKKKKKALGSGGVLNLMQSDTATLESLTIQFHTVYDGLIQIAIYSMLLYRYLGAPVTYGIGVLLISIPINSLALRVLNRLRKKEIEFKQDRTKKITESITNMKLLKLQSWEDMFASDVQKYRDEELQKHQERGVIRALNQAFSNAAPAISLVVTLYFYAKSGRPLVASTIFTSISLFNQLRFPLFFYPMLIDSVANAWLSLRRISGYLSQDEISQYVEYLPQIDGKGEITLRNGNFLWPAGGSSSKGEEAVGEPALCDASLSVGASEVVAVVGEVGSGKSALAKALIGEMSPVPRMVVNQSFDKDISEGPDVPRVVAYGSIAYCAQEAWLSKATIKESVVFDGEDCDEQRYNQAIYDAGLDADIASGALSHDTDVGEDGSNLSGGQRQRVALARALYQESAGVYILDDSLSALDASVGSTVFERVTSRLRKRGVATIFITNDPYLASRCDKVILMGSVAPSSSTSSSSSKAPSCSRIVDTGRYDELIARGHDLKAIVHPIDDEGSDEKYEKDVDNEPLVFDSYLASGGSQNGTLFEGDDDCHADPDCRIALKQDPSLLAEHVVPRPVEPTPYEAVNGLAATIIGPGNTTIAAVDTTEETKSDNDSYATSQSQNELSTDDLMSTGSVPLRTYLDYFRSVKSPLLIVLAAAGYLISNGSQFLQQFIIAKWTEVAEITAAVSAKYLQNLVYAAGIVSVSLWLRSFLIMQVGVRASRHIHQNMIRSVYKAPLSFFSATPSGQLLSRFGKELEIVDSSLPDSIGSVLFCFLQIFFSALALAGVVSPFMVLPIGLVGVFYAKTMRRFRPAARDLKRAESKSRSPIYSNFREALKGVDTIRTIPNGKRFWAGKNRSFLDKNLSVYYAVKSLDRWLSIRLEALGNTVVFATSILAVILTRAGRLKSGSAGWGLTQSLSITGLLAWAVRCLTDLEGNFLSVSRVLELTDGLDSTKTQRLPGDARMPKECSKTGEALSALSEQSDGTTVPLASPSDAALLKSGWPWKGHVSFENVSMRYNAKSPLVLENVSLDVPAGTTLGVVGRTGSGKSSLLLTLFRLVEIERSGTISIDGIDLRSLSLRGLRRSLSIIPQSPTLFAGTLMYNLDATGKATEEEAWIALEAASPELARQFRELDGLKSNISEGGENLSSGERQLICLARALLKKSKILVLDEATSSVDIKTDAQVQATIRREFVNKGVTVITVAHRLDTVLGYDKIAVLDAGKLVEYGPPSELVKIRQGYLRKLVDADRENRRKGGGGGSSKRQLQQQQQQERRLAGVVIP